MSCEIYGNGVKSVAERLRPTQLARVLGAEADDRDTLAAYSSVAFLVVPYEKISHMVEG